MEKQLAPRIVRTDGRTTRLDVQVGDEVRPDSLNMFYYHLLHILGYF